MESNPADYEAKKSFVNRLITFREPMRPDDVAAHYSGLGVALKISRLDPLDQHAGPGHILIEGDTKSLLFLADLLLAQAADESDCGYQVEAGCDSRFFAPDSQFGLYIHALPCPHTPGKTLE